jgi:hypothetical protein
MQHIELCHNKRWSAPFGILIIEDGIPVAFSFIISMMSKIIFLLKDSGECMPRSMLFFLNKVEAVSFIKIEIGRNTT